MTSSYRKFASVFPEKGPVKSLTYGIPEPLLDHVETGVSVRIPLRGRFCTGLVYCVEETCSLSKVLPIEKVLSPIPVITPELSELAFWMSRYYHSPLAKVLKIFSPGAVRRGMGHKEQRVISRGLSRDELRQKIIEMRNKSPKGAIVLDEILKVHKEIF